MGQVIGVELLVLPEEPGDYVARSLLWCMATLYALLLLYASPPLSRVYARLFRSHSSQTLMFPIRISALPSPALCLHKPYFSSARPSLGVYYSWHVYR